MKKSSKRRALQLLLMISIPTAMIWACSSPPPYGGGGRDLGPQGMPMGNESGAPDGADTGVDTGVDTGIDATGGG
jgi:hypothetical protein